MKKAGMVIVLLIVVAAILISGCSTQKTTLRVDNRFFAPIKTMAQKKALPPKASLTTNSLQRELAARTT